MNRDDWLYADQCAALAGISAAAWRRYTASTPARRAMAPERGRRCPDTGRPQWQRGEVLDWLAERAGSNHAAAQRRHRAILAARELNPQFHPATIASRLDLSEATVARHLSGRCSC